ncbi:putative secreted protein, SVM family protein [Candidatus Phytoplasma solani]|uniref:SVM family protein n=1 Tax=Candidatus Phytoplasma solani TaxID=69896 RepID=UPI0032DB8C13
MLIFRLKKQLYLLPIFLFSSLGLFLITNNQVMAMNNGHSNGYVQQNNRNVENEMTACRNLHDLLLEEARLTQEIYNALRNNASEETINHFKNQANQIAIQAENIRRNLFLNQ